MAADLEALRRAADLLDGWAKDVGYAAMLNDTDPHADRGTKLWSSVLMALAAKARAEAADMRWRAALSEASPNEGNGTEET